MTHAELASSSRVNFICGRMYVTVPPFLLRYGLPCAHVLALIRHHFAIVSATTGVSPHYVVIQKTSLTITLFFRDKVWARQNKFLPLKYCAQPLLLVKWALGRPKKMWFLSKVSTIVSQK